jgi:transcription antitermination protein NusB
MPLPQQKIRELIFQLLYSDDFAKCQENDLIEMYMRQFNVTKKNLKIAVEMRDQIVARLPEIDSMLSEVADAYSFTRIPGIERNILRLGVFELFFRTGIPPKVAISEAMRLARKFATSESLSFVNALLDALYQKSLAHAT